MAYEKINWLNKGEAGAKPINKTNLNHMDNGIETNDTNIGNLSNLNTTYKSNLVGAINEVNDNIYAKVGLTSNVSTTADTYNKIPYNSIIEIDDGLSLNNNGIKISKKGKYSVTLTARLNLTGTVYLVIRKNNNDSNEAIVSCNINGGVHTLTSVVNCQENDTIYGYIYSSNSITIFGGGNPPVWVSMVVAKM